MEEMIKVIDRYLLIEIPKELDHHNSEIIRERADHLLNIKNISTIIFDFEKTDFMDSSGIGIILGRYKNISMSGGTVVAIHLNNRLKRIFAMSGLNNLITVYDEMPL